RYEEAKAAARTIIERFPEHPLGHLLLVATAALQGDMQTAADALASALPITPASSTLARNRENVHFVGEAIERFIDGLRKAGMPGGGARPAVSLRSWLPMCEGPLLEAWASRAKSIRNGSSPPTAPDFRSIKDRPPSTLSGHSALPFSVTWTR